MPPNPDLPRRRATRLKSFDYSTVGAYFLTLRTRGSARLFGRIEDGQMWLNSAERMIELWWHELGSKFAAVTPDELAVMPDHFHGIVMREDARERSTIKSQPSHGEGGHVGPPLPEAVGARANIVVGASLDRIVQWFKTMTTNGYIRGVKDHKWTRFDDRLWQRGYYERVLRSERELNHVREYIKYNAAIATARAGGHIGPPLP